MTIAALVAWGSAVAAPIDPMTVPLVADSHVTSASTTIDTDALTFGGLKAQGEERNGIAVFAFGSLTIEHDISVTGSRPLALLATGDLTVRGRLEVAASQGGGDGAGGTYVAGPGGGHCGAGGAAGDGAYPGGEAYGQLLVSLSGGSRGGSSTTPGGGTGAAGGGAIELGALGVITVDADIVAEGASASERQKDAGGGGSGGGVLLHGGYGSVARGGIFVGGGDGGSSNTGLAGGGGGGGCVVSLGVAVEAEQLRLDGGAAGTEAGHGTTATAGSPSQAMIEVDPDYDKDTFPLSRDCNDLDPAIHPKAEDVPDGIDNDCDGVVDPQQPGPTGETGEPGPGPDTGGGANPPPPAGPPPGYAVCGVGVPAAPAGGFVLWVLALGRRRRERR